MTSDAWKNLERNAAKKLGGERILRGINFSPTGRMADKLKAFVCRKPRM